ncbi:hypothetical protein D3C87_462490 [compost metagenome]
MNEPFNVDQNMLVNAWQQQLPEFLNSGDSAQVLADAKDPQSLRIHINAAGHQFYSFDFQCTYLDPREIKVSLVDVERGGDHVDERGDVIQDLAADYSRHLHECAQALHRITNQS